MPFWYRQNSFFHTVLCSGNNSNFICYLLHLGTHPASLPTTLHHILSPHRLPWPLTLWLLPALGWKGSSLPSAHLEPPYLPRLSSSPMALRSFCHTPQPAAQSPFPRLALHRDRSNDGQVHLDILSLYPEPKSVLVHSVLSFLPAFGGLCPC